MDRHDRPSPGRYDESRPATPTEYLQNESAPPSGSGRRTLVISAAAAVLAAAVTAGGVITLTGGSSPAAGMAGAQSSDQAAGPGQDAADLAAGPDDASEESGGSDDGFTEDAGSPGSAGNDGSAGGDADRRASPVGRIAQPVANHESAKNRKNTSTKTATRTEARGPGPDGPAGYVQPLAQPPEKANGLGASFMRLGPIGTPSSPTATPSAKPSAKPAPKPAPKPTKTAPKPAPSATSPGSSKLVTAENEVARLTNVAREAEGCGPLRIDEKLRKAARGHSDDMAAKGYFDHTSADGRSPWDRIKAAGYNSSMFAENIARGQATPDAVVKGWLNSPGHRANIMNCKLKAIGVGVHLGSGGPWWTQDFGSD